MFNGNYINIDSIIATVSKYPFTEGVNKREVSRALVDLMSLIGAVIPFQRKYKVIPIKMHKGALPSDMTFIHGVRNKGLSCDTPGGVPMRYATDIYHSALHSEAAKKECGGTYLSNTDMESLYGPKAQGDYKETGGVLEMSLRTWQTGQSIPRQYYENSYTINGSNIDTSFPEGYVEIAYDGVKLDDNGYPMIPDDKPFIEALKYFILKRYSEPAYFRGEVPRHVYHEINTQYDWYVGSAMSSFNMPNPDQMESLISGLVRVLPRNNNHSDGYKSLNKKEGNGVFIDNNRNTLP